MAESERERRQSEHTAFYETAVHIPVDGIVLEGNLAIPARTRGVVLFAHGSGSSRHSPRNRFVAASLQNAGFATLLLDLLTAEEEALDDQTGELRFDIELLAGRLVGATRWVSAQSQTAKLPIAYFGASTGAAAALIAATRTTVAAIVSRGGRPDLAGGALSRVVAPTLLIVGGKDAQVLELNRKAFDLIPAQKRLEIVPGATHLFEEPGTLKAVADLAENWFRIYLARADHTKKVA